MNSVANEFLKLLDNFDKEGCAKWVKKSIEEDKMSIRDLYFNVLAPSLSKIADNYNDQKIPIWQEHLKTTIVRTMVETCYFYVLKSSPKIDDRKKIIVSCLDEEQHDIGARMICDLLTMDGFDVYFLGANTTKEQMLLAIESIRPSYYAISITNYYHLTRLEKSLQFIRKSTHLKVKFVIGGFAVTNTPEVETMTSAEFVIKDINDLDRLKGDFV